MNHKAYIRIVPGAETAILFVHGILGSPRHFDMFLPLIPDNISAYALLLPGHGKGVKDFSDSSMDVWIRCVDDAVEELLRSHKRVLMVAHSMGTLFSIQQAVKRPEGICGLFLLAAPLKLFIKPAMVANVLKLYLNKIDPAKPKELATKTACSIIIDKRFWLYFSWIPRYLELFRQISATGRIAEKVQQPCWAYQSKQDEMVALSAGKILRKIPGIRLNILLNSSHYYYEPVDREYLLSQFREFLKEML